MKYISQEHQGFDSAVYGRNQNLKMINQSINCPVVISGGAGDVNHFVKAAKFSSISGLCASSIFHFDKLNIKSLKEDLKKNNIEIVE